MEGQYQTEHKEGYHHTKQGLWKRDINLKGNICWHPPSRDSYPQTTTSFLNFSQILAITLSIHRNLMATYSSDHSPSQPILGYAIPKNAHIVCSLEKLTCVKIEKRRKGMAILPCNASHKLRMQMDPINSPKKCIKAKEIRATRDESARISAFKT